MLSWLFSTSTIFPAIKLLIPIGENLHVHIKKIAMLIVNCSEYNCNVMFYTLTRILRFAWYSNRTEINTSFKFYTLCNILNLQPIVFLCICVNIHSISLVIRVYFYLVFRHWLLWFCKSPALYYIKMKLHDQHQQKNRNNLQQKSKQLKYVFLISLVWYIANNPCSFNYSRNVGKNLANKNRFTA